MRQVCAGNEHTVLLSSSGSVFACGYNDSGQCGISSATRIPMLRKIDAFEGRRIAQLHSSNGCEHLLAVSDTGELYSCGYNARGQLGHGQITQVPSPRLVTALLGMRVEKVACSYYHTVVAVAGGSWFGFGRNDFGQLGCEHQTDSSTPQRIEALEGKTVKDLACGQYHTIAAMEGGGVYAWGKNDYGQLGVSCESTNPKMVPGLCTAPLDTAAVVKVACGYYHSVILSRGGQVWTFGRNDYGQLGIGSRENMPRPTAVAALEDHEIADVACGCYHTVSLSHDGKVFPFGRNNHGQLGTGNTVDALRPTFIQSLNRHRVWQIAAGFYHTILLTGDPLQVADLPLKNNTLANDLKGMLNNPARSDITFVVEGKPIYAHRCILMARCEPLERMLDGGFREDSAPEIVIQG